MARENGEDIKALRAIGEIEQYTVSIDIIPLRGTEAKRGCRWQTPTGRNSLAQGKTMRGDRRKPPLSFGEGPGVRSQRLLRA
jgi:hypothetical protein